jgi:E3 ubiquitin-protein ligase HECTD4
MKTVCIGIALYSKILLLSSNGRAVHYNGSSLLQWKSARLDVGLSAGDVAGVGWERQGDTPALPGQQVRGQVYFTYNGERLAATLDDVSGGLWPVVHIQKKVSFVNHLLFLLNSLFS